MGTPDENPQSKWKPSRTGVLPPTFDPSPNSAVQFYNPASIDEWRFNAVQRFVRPPSCGPNALTILAASNYAAIGIVNVTNYDDYAWADSEGLSAYTKAQGSLPKNDRSTAGSIETTHSMIRLLTDPTPFLFVSAITDREGAFNVDVGSHAYAQNFACAHNAGVALSWALPRIIGTICSPVVKDDSSP